HLQQQPRRPLHAVAERAVAERGASPHEIKTAGNAAHAAPWKCPGRHRSPTWGTIFAFLVPTKPGGDPGTDGEARTRPGSVYGLCSSAKSRGADVPAVMVFILSKGEKPKLFPGPVKHLFESHASMFPGSEPAQRLRTASLQLATHTPLKRRRQTVLRSRKELDSLRGRKRQSWSPPKFVSSKSQRLDPAQPLSICKSKETMLLDCILSMKATRAVNSACCSASVILSEVISRLRSGK